MNIILAALQKNEGEIKVVNNREVVIDVADQQHTVFEVANEKETDLYAKGLQIAFRHFLNRELTIKQG